MTKTNVMRLLDAAKIPYRAAEYEVDENDLNGMHAAEGIGMPPEQIFKTLVAKGERGGYALGLAPADEGALCLRDVAEELEHYVGDYDAGEVSALARVEQRHVEDDYFRLFFLREQPPLFEYLGVVAPEAVYAFDYEGVSAAELVD